MKTNDVSFPYPVLGISDDIIPGLPENPIVIKISHDANNFEFEVSLQYENKDIQELISTKFAEYTCEIDCPKTLLRKSYKFSASNFIVQIPRKSVNGRVELNFYVSVKKSIEKYINKGFNSDYYGYSFDLEEGDILAVFGTCSFDADIKYDKLQAAGSFLEIGEGVGEEMTRFVLDTEKIRVLLPTPMFKLYRDSLGGKYQEIMHSSIAFNALTCALYELDDHKVDTLWGRTIMYRLNHEEELSGYLQDADDGHIYVENVTEVAMKMLKDPYNRMFVYLNSLDSNKED